MSQPSRAKDLHLLACSRCHQLSRRPPTPAGACECPRCGNRLEARKPQSLARTSALLITAALMYVPANTLPIMRTTTLFREREDTLLGGILALWKHGSWELAVVVFVASVVIPIAKIAAMSVLAWSVRAGWIQGARERTRLFRLLEWIGPWSMLDIFVVVLMVALVQFSALARVEPGPGALAFGAVVVLTMFAAQCFDPRLMWDAAREHHVDG